LSSKLGNLKQNLRKCQEKTSPESFFIQVMLFTLIYVNPRNLPYSASWWQIPCIQVTQKDGFIYFRYRLLSHSSLFPTLRGLYIIIARQDGFSN